jgi:hypothetical protein
VSKPMSGVENLLEYGFGTRLEVDIFAPAIIR